VPDNVLYYGDNLDILRRHVADESVDLVYLDPPFNSNATYNVLFAEQHGERAASQIRAFEDTWTWDYTAEWSYRQTVEAGGQVSKALQAFHTLLGPSNMLAYLAMMAPRLVELRRVLKLTGSIYLHCDPTASHYLKLLMDAVFGPENYVNEITWKRAHTVKGNFGQGSKMWSRNTDTLLFYRKTDANVFHQQFNEYSEEYLRKFYRFQESDGRRYRLISMIGPGGSAKGNPQYEVMGVTRYWRYSRENMQQLIEDGLVVQTKPGTVPVRKQYLDQGRGVAVQSLWDDIPALGPQQTERLGYPTQKPLALLERIVSASSDEGDVVLDPFCGCGTATAAAQKLGRHWVGIDVTHLAITLIKARLRDAFNLEAGKDYTVLGEPVSVPDAEALAATDPWQFQWWSLGLVGARPVEQKKGADKGIDGRLYFHDEPGAETKQVILSVKAGHNLGVGMVRDLGHVVQREGAVIGVLITMREPTGPMKTEAVSAGFYDSPWGGSYPRLQILTVAQLLAGEGIKYPHVEGMDATFKRAPKAAKAEAPHPELPLGD